MQRLRKQVHQRNDLVKQNGTNTKIYKKAQTATDMMDDSKIMIASGIKELVWSALESCSSHAAPWAMEHITRKLLNEGLP